jgi:hypothetical protein
LGTGHQTVGAGIGFWFSSGTGNPAQRFTAVIEFEDDWWDKATGYVAHNDARTWLSVWGTAENGWVSTSANQTPTWSDGVGWTEAHQNNESGTASLVTHFNARPNSAYFCTLMPIAAYSAMHSRRYTSATGSRLQRSIKEAKLLGRREQFAVRGALEKNSNVAPLIADRGRGYGLVSAAPGRTTPTIGPSGPSSSPRLSSGA